MRTTTNQKSAFPYQSATNPAATDLQKQIKALCPDRPGLYRKIESTTDLQELTSMLANCLALASHDEDCTHDDYDVDFDGNYMCLNPKCPNTDDEVQDYSKRKFDIDLDNALKMSEGF